MLGKYKLTGAKIAAKLDDTLDALEPLETLDPAALLIAVNPAVARVVRLAASDAGTIDAVVTLGGLVGVVDTDIPQGADADAFLDELYIWADTNKAIIPAVSVERTSSVEIALAPGAAANDIAFSTDDPTLSFEDVTEGADPYAGSIAPDQLSTGGGGGAVTARPTTGVLTIEMAGIVTNTGAISTSTQTLPDSSLCYPGLRFEFIVTEEERSFRVKPSAAPSADHMIGYFLGGAFDIPAGGADLRSSQVGSKLTVVFLGGTTWNAESAGDWA